MCFIIPPTVFIHLGTIGTFSEKKASLIQKIFICSPFMENFYLILIKNNDKLQFPF